jgi:hypothetical protein
MRSQSSRFSAPYRKHSIALAQRVDVVTAVYQSVDVTDVYLWTSDALREAGASQAVPNLKTQLAC